MKNALLILMVILFSQISDAQNETHDDLWKEVAKLESEGLPASALKIVEQIEAEAKATKNTSLEIKCMLYKSKYALILQEDAQLKIIADFKAEIDKSIFPKKNILENLLANLYWQYFNEHRWQFYNRTKTSEKVDQTDFRTWDLQTLFNEIHFYFQKSLKNGLMLQQENLDDYALILSEVKTSKIYRPTLFDLLNHNALQFYKTNETQITKPAYKFEIDNPDLLSDSKTFAQITLASKDSTSLQLNALKIYQDLIAFHIKDKSPAALSDVDIDRLKFVHTHATFSAKDVLFLAALEEKKEQYKTNKASALYAFEIASLYHRQGLKYNPRTNGEQRWKLKEAIRICNAAIKQFPDSRGAKNCKVLKTQIEQGILQITTESFLPIQKEALMLVRYKNLDNLDFNIYKISRNELEKFNRTYRKDEQLKFISGLNSVKNWNSNLKNEGDYQMHSTEIVIPKLDNGIYIVVAKDRSNPDTFAFSDLQVTNLALVETEKSDSKVFQVINRNTGAPISNTKVELTYNFRNERNKQTKTYTTNNLGEVVIPKTASWYHGVTTKVIFKEDTAYFGQYYISQYREEKKPETSYKSFLFTDRSIYRPGQTVYFKAILIEKDINKSQPFTNQTVFATLYNINGEKLSELDFETNEYGSISGEFILPSSGLNGEYYIEIYTTKGSIRDNHFFSVEEYKRPKFEANFKPITETYKVNDSITTQGNALAYAGSKISDAKVVYRVRRKVEYPRWFYWYRPWFNSEPLEIIHGETATDASGNFQITFRAIPDKSVDKNSLPIFKYEVTADVTDLNGETRSANTIINVGYHALVANMSLDKTLNKSKKDHIVNIETTNLNGEFVAARGTLKVFKLKAPENVLRERPWPAPDYKMLSKAAFKKLFPHEAYNNEHDSNNWERDELVLVKSFNTAESKTIELAKIKNWKSGKYLITLESKDRFGQLVKDEVKTTVFDSDKILTDNQLFTISTNKKQYKEGDTVELCIASAAKNLHITLSVEKDKKIISTEIIQLSNDQHTISIPVTKDDIGGFAVHYSFAAYNNFQFGTELINVPYPKTDLEIETLTFRDKLQPGTDETWKFKIKGPKGEKVSSELLASMYDASLDQFTSHEWAFNPLIQSSYYTNSTRNAHRSFGTKTFRVYQDRIRPNYTNQSYDKLNWFGFYFGNRPNRFAKALRGSVAGIQVVEDQIEVEESVMLNAESDLDEVVVTDSSESKEENDTDGFATKEKPNFDNIKIRKNLQETAFFFPHLTTDDNGNVSFSFTTPEALTQWKLQLLAHTKTLESATQTLTTVTQKELMVIPNAPRFLREGDEISISTKISNLTEKALSGEAKLFLTDAISGKDITTSLIDSSGIKGFSVEKEENAQVSWKLNIPENLQAVQYKIVAKSESFSDGEQNTLPVLSNRMLVTETLPMWVKSNETRTFTLDKLASSASATNLKHHKLTLEMTSNPAWYAVQALPYLMEYPYDCNEQTFSRYYANALASHIANSNPRIQAVFNQWASQKVLISNLEKNQELKSIIIQETPWLRDAQSETEQKKRIALLFDLNKMNNELQLDLNKLKSNQMASGAWAWFKGGYDNRFITQHIIAGFGHLKKLNVTLRDDKDSQKRMIENAISYLDKQFIKEYNDIRKYDADVDLNNDHLSHTQLHYMYMRSFFPEITKSKKVENIMSYYQIQIQKYWLSRSLYSKGTMALVSHRNGDISTTSKILNSLKETSITSNELGMYWKENENSWYWYQAPIETQALMIEVFSEAGTSIQDAAENTETIDNLKIWLLKNKQTKKWKTTKATTQAVYALLLQGSDWLSVTEMVDVVLSGNKIEAEKLENSKIEAGTGYYKTSWNSEDVQPNMANVKLFKKGKGIAWGALYWQYFEDLDKITSAKTPLTLKKKLFLKKNTDRGEEITRITENTKLELGDLVRVRIELKSDHSMEFIHMKDMRASGLEPVNVLSTYKWQDGLGYYQSTKDASTNFFFDYLPKGVFVFEYDLRVNSAGNMSNVITTIQSMYAPEFSSHSKGTRINVQ